MPFKDIRRCALTSLIVAAITLGPAFAAGQAGVQPEQYRSPEGVEYRSLPDTDAVKSARAALEADPRNIARIIDLGVAQSGARQFREAIATFTRGLEIEPNHALLLRWRGHRYLSVREFDRAFADLTRGGAIDSTIYGIWYHLGIVQYLRGDFAAAAASFAKAQDRKSTRLNSSHLGISYAVFCLKKKKKTNESPTYNYIKSSNQHNVPSGLTRDT